MFLLIWRWKRIRKTFSHCQHVIAVCERLYREHEELHSLDGWDLYRSSTSRREGGWGCCLQLSLWHSECSCNHWHVNDRVTNHHQEFGSVSAFYLRHKKIYSRNLRYTEVNFLCNIRYTYSNMNYQKFLCDCDSITVKIPQVEECSEQVEEIPPTLEARQDHHDGEIRS